MDGEKDRFVVAVRKGLAPGRTANVVSHLSLGLVAAAHERGDDWVDRMRFDRFPDASGQEHGPVSALGSIIIAGRPSWVRRLRDEAPSEKLLRVDFTDLMTIGSGSDQRTAMSGSQEPELEYLGVGLFGPAQVLEPLTSRFSLYR